MKLKEPKLNMNHNIWLCDLTHSYQTIALNRIPLGIGFIASYFKNQGDNAVNLKLFRHIEKLRDAFDEECPEIIGFSNSIMNQNLNFEFARLIKKQYPGVIIVFGGPNFPEELERRNQYLLNAPWIDFYLLYEGEKAFFELAQKLIHNNFDLNRTKESEPFNCAYRHQEKLYISEVLPRIDINDIPSPYTTGIFDEFLDEYKPLVQYARGCPFSCTFCTMSIPSWRKINHLDTGSVFEEIQYIAEHVKTESDLFIADSNFGMYEEDLLKSKAIAKIQEKYKWPSYITASTGKNKLHKVIEVLKTLNGAPITTLAVQSTDKSVLKNIHRDNISMEKLFEFAIEATKFSSLVYSDIILGLPGDSIGSHMKSIKDVMEAGIETIILHSLMLFEGSELSTDASKGKYKMVTKYRCLPRCFGKYKLNGENDTIVVEVEEICVANETLTIEDYLICRSFHLTIELFYNDSIFGELLELIKYFEVPVFEFIKAIHINCLLSNIKDLYSDFISEVENELWDSPEEIIEYIKQPGLIEKYKDGEFGANLILKYKSKALVDHFEILLDIAFDTAFNSIQNNSFYKKDNMSIEKKKYLKELKQYCLYQKSNMLNPDIIYQGDFNFPFEFLFSDVGKTFSSRKKYSYRFLHSKEQKKMIEFNKNFYGENLVGIAKLFAQISAKKFFRRVEK